MVITVLVVTVKDQHKIKTGTFQLFPYAAPVKLLSFLL